MVTDTSTFVSVLAVAVLLAGVVAALAVLSTVAVAVSVSGPLAAASTVAVRVYVTLAPGARLAIVSVRSPGTPVCPFPVQLTAVSPAGRASVTWTVVAVPDPAAVATVTVYVTVSPGAAPAGA